MTSTIPDAYKSYFNIPNSQVEQLYKLLLSIELYLNEKISLSKAAELCDFSFEDFVKELRLRKIQRLVGINNIEDIEEDQIHFDKYAKKSIH